MASPTSPQPSHKPSDVVPPAEEQATGSSEDEHSPLSSETPSIVVQPPEEQAGSAEDERNITDEQVTSSEDEQNTSSEDEFTSTDEDGVSEDEEKSEERRAQRRQQKEDTKALQLNVKMVHPNEDDSEIKQAITADNWERLSYLMDLGEFSVDRSSSMAKVLSQKGQSGLTYLANLCVYYSSPECMTGLIMWARNPDHSYWINEKHLFDYAKEVALTTGNMICCVELMEKRYYGYGKEEQDPIIDLANELYPLVKGLELNRRVAKIMYGRWKEIYFYPHLVYQCGVPGIHSSVVATTVVLIIEAGDSFDVPGYQIGGSTLTEVPLPNDGKKRAPLSEAARVLNREIVKLLTHSVPIVNNLRYRIINNWKETAEYNPLFTLLKQEFPYLTPATHTDFEEEEEDKRINHPDDKSVYFQLQRAGHAMLECLKDIKDRIRETEGYKSSHYADMYQVACDIYMATIRELIIRQIRRHLPRRVQATLIELKPESQPFAEDSQKTPTQADQKTPTQATHAAEANKAKAGMGRSLTHPPPANPSPAPEKDEDKPEPTSPSQPSPSPSPSPDTTKSYKLLPTINGTFLRKTLQNYDLLDLNKIFTSEIWPYLVEYENIKLIQSKIRAKIEYPKLKPNSALLYEYILDPDNRTHIVEQRGPRSSFSSSASASVSGSETGGDTTEEKDEPLKGSWSGVVMFGAGHGEYVPDSGLL